MVLFITTKQPLGAVRLNKLTLSLTLAFQTAAVCWKANSNITFFSPHNNT